MVLFMVFNCVWEQVKTLKKMKGITTNAMAKMGKGGDVSTQVLSKICKALDCKIEDIVEVEKTIDSP